MVTVAQRLLDGQICMRTKHERAWKDAGAALDHIPAAALGIWTDLEIANGQSHQGRPHPDRCRTEHNAQGKV